MTLGDMLANFLAAAALRTVFNAAEPGGFSRDTKEGEALRSLAHRVYHDISAGRRSCGRALRRGLFSSRHESLYGLFDHDVVDKLNEAHVWTVYWLDGCACAGCRIGAMQNGPWQNADGTS